MPSSGENGAGKSTLIKIICGIYTPDEGEVLLDGERMHLHSYKDALDHKINLVSQEIQVIPKSTVAENIMLDKLERYAERGAIDWKRLNRDAEQYIDLVALRLPSTTLVGGLSAAQKQLIMIARSLSSNARILIMDEPTSALTRHETENLLQLLTTHQGRRRHRYVCLAQAGRGARSRRQGFGAARRQPDRHAPAAGLTKPEIVTMMIGRDARTSSLGTLDAAAATSRCSRPGILSQSGNSTGSASRCIRARSWASMGWSARGAPSWRRS